MLHAISRSYGGLPIGTAVGGEDDGERSDAFPVPAYLPSPARSMLPFARAYAAAAARRYGLPLADCWDEAITALIRAAVYFRPGAGRFHTYARTAVVRGLWRYCRRPARRAIPLDAVQPGTLPDVESLLIALEDGRRAHTAGVPVYRSRAS